MSATYIHPTAEIDPAAHIGDGCAVWNWSKVREGAVVGDGTKIGQAVYIDHGVRLGCGCKVQNNVSLYHGLTCGDHVFIGPNATFTNDLLPRAAAGDDWTVVPTTVEDHASIGANATIVCGVTLGEGCMVGAGAVVTRDVPPWALVVGSPARIIGWVDVSGARECRLLLERLAMADVRVAVVGVGGMGSNHARVLAGAKGAELVGVMDSDPAKAAAVADTYGCRVLESIDEVAEAAEAATIAVPSTLHAEVAVPLLRAGVHCLVEKPFVTSAADGEEVIAAARESGAHVLVGHIERFNPAVRQLRTILAEDHEILAVDARRMSAVSGRITDVDVVTDLMVHDLDIVVDLVRRPVVDLVARSVRGADKASGDDYVTVLLTFDSGAMASITASRITQNQVRELQVTTDQRFFTLDYPNQALLIYRQGRIGGLDPGDTSRYVLDIGTERVFVRRTEPLASEIAHFLDVARGRCEPEVSAEHGLAVMRLVWDIHAALGKEVVGD